MIGGDKAPFLGTEVRVERRIVNPWTWQDQFGYVQANETSGVERVLHCAGQTSVDADGQPLHAGDMGAQVGQAVENLETVLGEAGFALADVVRLNFYVTDVDAFIAAGEVYGAKLAQAGCRPASTLLGVSRLASPSLLVEVEATAVQ
jgi:enamine deaminase RidA (YjgF/YER057c/UK114 family)